MDLKSLSSLGRIEKEVELTKDLKLKLHTLTALEQQKALAELPSALSDTAYRGVILQMAILIYATDAVNGEKVTTEQAKDFYNSLQSTLFAEAYLRYDELAKEQDTVLAELKKKISKAGNTPPFRELYLVAKALGISPFSPELTKLSQPEFFWILMNYYKDQEEVFENTKILCRFLNPEAATKVFDQTVIDSGEADSQEVYEELSKELGGKYSAAEIASMTNDPEHAEHLDRIERVE